MKIHNIGNTKTGAPQADVTLGLWWWKRRVALVSITDEGNRRYWSEYNGAGPFDWSDPEGRTLGPLRGPRLSKAYRAWCLRGRDEESAKRIGAER